MESRTPDLNKEMGADTDIQAKGNIGRKSRF